MFSQDDKKHSWNKVQDRKTSISCQGNYMGQDNLLAHNNNSNNFIKSKKIHNMYTLPTFLQKLFEEGSVGMQYTSNDICSDILDII